MLNLCQEGRTRLIDAAWDAAVAVTLATGLVIASMFTIGWAEQLRVIPMVTQHCHYSGEVQTC
jgi:hypothetical protein